MWNIYISNFFSKTTTKFKHESEQAYRVEPQTPLNASVLNSNKLFLLFFAYTE